MFQVWLHFVFLYLAVLLPLGAARRMKTLMAQPPAPGEPATQLRIYPRLIAGQWATAAAVVVVLWRMGVPPAWIGVRLPGRAPFLEVTALLAVAWVVWDWRLQRAVRDPARRARLLTRFANIRRFLPVNDAMFRWWIAVSITAGVCEEALYRGFVGFYLHQWMSLEVAAVVGSLVFGFAHVYQGWKGMLRTAAVGAILWLVYLFTHSLLPGMVLHAALDVRSGQALRNAIARDAAEAAAAPPAPTGSAPEATPA